MRASPAGLLAERRGERAVGRHEGLVDGLGPAERERVGIGAAGGDVEHDGRAPQAVYQVERMVGPVVRALERAETEQR